MAGVRYTVIALVLLTFTGADGLAHCKLEDDVDVASLAKDSIFSTAELAMEGVSVESVVEAMDSELKKNNELNEIVTAVENERAANADNPIPTSIAADTTGDAVVDAQLSLTLQAYYHTCPYRAWWLRRGYWYFYGGTSDGTRYYYWVYYSWWYTSCGQQYCNVSFKVPWYWYHYHKCFAEYRRVWFWTRCLTIDPNGTVTWSNRLIYRYVPRGCCCRRYWRALTFLQCPVGGG